MSDTTGAEHLHKIIPEYQGESNWWTELSLWKFTGEARLIEENLNWKYGWQLAIRLSRTNTDPSYIDHLLKDGGAKVQPIADKTLMLVKERIGLGDNGIPIYLLIGMWEAGDLMSIHNRCLILMKY